MSAVTVHAVQSAYDNSLYLIASNMSEAIDFIFDGRIYLNLDQSVRITSWQEGKPVRRYEPGEVSSMLKDRLRNLRYPPV